MKRLRSVLPGLIGIMLLYTSAAAETEKLTLEQSIQIALEQNPAVSMAKEGVKRADAMVDEAFSAGLPRITVDGTYQRLDRVNTIDFGDESIDTGSLDNRTANLILVQPIDLFGTIKTAKRAARVGRSIYTYGSDRQTNDTILDTKVAFFGVLRAQKFLEVQEETINQLQAHLDEAQKQYRAGTIAKFDVLRAETEVANARQGLIAAQNGTKLAKSGFNNVLGRPLDTPVDLIEPEKPDIMELDLAVCIDSACRNRPEILQADSQVKLNDEIAKIAKLGSKPTVGVRWAYNRNFDVTLFNSRDSSWTGFLSASMPLYDGGATRASVDKAQSDTRNSRFMREQVLQGVTLDAQQSNLNVRESLERMAAAEKGMELAREANRLANVRYQGGVSTQLEVLDSQTALTQAETNYVNALYDYQVALARLERAVGGPTYMAKLMETNKQQVAASSRN